MLIVKFHRTAWPCQRDEFRYFDMKKESVLTPLHMVRSLPNFPCLMRVLDKTSTLQFWIIVIAPPTGNRKLIYAIYRRSANTKSSYFAVSEPSLPISGETVTAAAPCEVRKGAKARSVPLAAFIVLVLLRVHRVPMCLPLTTLAFI